MVLQDPSKRSFHFCIVNLVIGTLYCVKGNYEFGIARIIKSMEPESKKLETDTWFYAKRCFLALFEGVAKHMITLKVDKQLLEHCTGQLMELLLAWCLALCAWPCTVVSVVLEHTDCQLVSWKRCKTCHAHYHAL